jgi:hypothetical protein
MLLKSYSGEIKSQTAAGSRMQNPHYALPSTHATKLNWPSKLPPK